MTRLGVRLRRLFGGTDRRSSAPERPAHEGSARPESSAGGDSDFALAMYRVLQAQTGNLFFSPLSIRIALGMAYAGANGETAAQISQALRSSASDEAPLHATLAAIIQRLNAASGGNYEIALASSLWAQEGSPVQAGFLDVMARHYADGLNRVDFRRAANDARAAINRWVEDRTTGKIRELIAAGGLGADTRVVMVNAVYFKGTWQLQFPRAHTRRLAFHLEGGRTVDTLLMHRSASVRHVQADGYQAVELFYQGRDISMIVFLPDRKDGLPDFEDRLSPKMLHDCVAHMTYREVDLILPRFRITWGSFNMRDPLGAMGVTLPFDPFEADFSGINGYKAPHGEALFISALYHKAFVETTEEGTEAAAATAVGLTLGGPIRLVPVFRADHPFLFAVRECKSGAILFLGRLAHPSQDRWM